MKEQFIDQRFHGSSQLLIDRADAIISEYQDKGQRLSLRQLYYQFVTRFDYENSVKSYRKLAGAISLGRLAGLLDWNGIEDRGRSARKATEHDSVDDAVFSALEDFRLDRWRGQTNYVEVWIEKDALSGVLSPLAIANHVVLLANKGYSSQTAMYEASKRFIEAGMRPDDTSKKCILLYLGDHDPSREDMVRDIRDRLRMFGAEVEVIKIALTIDQVRKWKLPHNPVGIRAGKGRPDPRMADYVRQFGRKSWEVDALPPEELTRLIQEAIDRYLDRPLMDKVIELEETEKARVRSLLEATPLACTLEHMDDHECPKPKPRRCRRKHSDKPKRRR